MTKEHEPAGQVGCIDGRVLDVSRDSGEVLLTIGDTEIRLSVEAAARLASLVATDPSPTATTTLEPQEDQQDPSVVGVENDPEGEDSDPEPEPDGRSVPATDEITAADDKEPATKRQPRGDDRKRYEIDGRAVRVRDLLDAGLLAMDDLLTWRRTRKAEFHRTRVLTTGKILLDDGSGQVFDAPSKAATAASGLGSYDGWLAWRTADGRLLSELRDELLERIAPTVSGESDQPQQV